MTPEEHDEAYTQGQRQVYIELLRMARKGLGSDESQQISWEIERAEAVQQLRALCAVFGDLDWDDALHLGDAIEKHLGRHLHENADVS